MSKLTSQRLGLFKVPIGVALLRNMKVPEVPEKWTEEPLEGTNPFDLADFVRSKSSRTVSIAISWRTTSSRYCLFPVLSTVGPRDLASSKSKGERSSGSGRENHLGT